MYRTPKSVMFKKPVSYIRLNSNAYYILDYINKHTKSNVWVPLVDIKNYACGFHSESYKRLLDQGLLITKRDPNDARKKLVRLTNKGKRAILLLNTKF